MLWSRGHSGSAVTPAHDQRGEAQPPPDFFLELLNGGSEHLEADAMKRIDLSISGSEQCVRRGSSEASHAQHDLR